MNYLKLLCILSAISINLVSVRLVYAASGACSSHGGVDCSAGSDSDGSVICNDGWRNSSVSYWSMVECSVFKTPVYRPAISDPVAVEACSNHGGIACNRILNDSQSVVCADYTTDASATYYDKCVHNAEDLIHYSATLQCQDVISSAVNAGSAYLGGTCLADKKVFLAKQFFPKCEEAVIVKGDQGTCVSYKDFCSPGATAIWKSSASVCSQFLSSSTSDSATKGAVVELEKKGVYNPTKKDVGLQNRLQGRILLQIEDGGKAWYMNPVDSHRYYMKDGSAAFSMMRSFGLGIGNADLSKIPAVSNAQDMLSVPSICSSNAFAKKLKGKILLQVQSRGEAWYVDPVRCRRIYMQNGEVAYQIMRYLGLGIKNIDLEKLPTPPEAKNMADDAGRVSVQKTTEFEMQTACKEEAEKAFLGDKYLNTSDWTFRSHWNSEKGRCLYSLFHHYISPDGSTVSVTEMIREAPENGSYGQFLGIGVQDKGVTISCSMGLEGSKEAKSCKTTGEWRTYTQSMMDYAYAIEL